MDKLGNVFFAFELADFVFQMFLFDKEFCETDIKEVNNKRNNLDNRGIG